MQSVQVHLSARSSVMRADELRRRGGDKGEFGATTGRPRRIGWFDAVASRYGCRIGGATEVALTVLDILGYLDGSRSALATRSTAKLSKTSR